MRPGEVLLRVEAIVGHQARDDVRPRSCITRSAMFEANVCGLAINFDDRVGLVARAR